MLVGMIGKWVCNALVFSNYHELWILKSYRQPICASIRLKYLPTVIFIDRANFLCQNVKQKIRQDRNFLTTLICVSSRSKHNVSVSAFRPFLWYSLNCIMETAVLESIKLIKISHFKPTVKWHNLGFWCHHRKEIKTFWLGRWLMWHQMS